MSRSVEPERLAMPLDGSGMVLGRDTRERLMRLRLFGPQPTRAAAVGGEWLARLLAFRALGVGARVLARTDDADGWLRFGHVSTLRHDRIMVCERGPFPVLAAGPADPLLVIDDSANPGGQNPPDQPWTTTLTMVRTLTHRTAAPLHAAHATLLQRLDGAEADVARAVLRIDDRKVLLRSQSVFDDIVMLVTAGAGTVVKLCPTPVEQSMLGRPGRVRARTP